VGIRYETKGARVGEGSACSTITHLVCGCDQALILREHQDYNKYHVDLTGTQRLGAADGAKQRKEQRVWIGARERMVLREGEGGTEGDRLVMTPKEEGVGEGHRMRSDGSRLGPHAEIP
jgi:hypothetical protein